MSVKATVLKVGICGFKGDRPAETHYRLGDVVEERCQLLAIDCPLPVDVVQVEDKLHLWEGEGGGTRAPRILQPYQQYNRHYAIIHIESALRSKDNFSKI